MIIQSVSLDGVDATNSSTPRDLRRSVGLLVGLWHQADCVTARRRSVTPRLGHVTRRDRRLRNLGSP
jgi:hypothetical protein